jgi:hypothetical protein
VVAERRRVPERSAWEEQVACSILYGLLHGLLIANGPLIAEQFNYLGTDISQNDEGIPGLHFDGLVVHMASGDYRVTVERVS